LPGGDLEYAVLAKLWELGSASARTIHNQVGKPRRLVYTTTAKVLDRLYAKRLVTRERIGKAFIYHPRIARSTIDEARAHAFLTRLLGPAPRTAVAALVEAADSIEPKLLDELAAAIAARRRSKRGT
jgi:predicted transcriptional regulator